MEAEIALFETGLEFLRDSEAFALGFVHCSIVPWELPVHFKRLNGRSPYEFNAFKKKIES